jgi:sugar porter (SP) family MFS transporter
MYIAELAPMDMRGRLTTLEEVFLNFGVLAGYVMNWLLLGIQNDWRWMLGLGSLLPLAVLLLVMLPCMPESPRWLVTRGRHEEAEKILTTFVGKEEAQRDMKAMLAQQDHSQDFVTWHQVLFSCHDTKIRNMLIAGTIVAVGQMLCGYLAMAYYSSTVLKNTMGERPAFIATIVMGIVKLVVALVTLAVLEQVGRRSMLLLSASVCSISCAWLAIAFAVDATSLMPAIGFSLFMAGFSLGLGPITFVYVAEVFPTKWRAKGMAVCLCLSRVFGFASTFVFLLLVDAMGTSGCFWLMSLVNVLLFGLIWTLVFETHGKSLESVDEVFADPSKAL